MITTSPAITPDVEPHAAAKVGRYVGIAISVLVGVLMWVGQVLRRPAPLKVFGLVR